MNTIPNQQLLDALNWRNATKVFDPNRKLSADTWATLERSLVLSPSSFGLQPYRFLVAQGLAAVVCCALGYRSPTDKYATAPKVRFDRAQLVTIL